MAEKAKNIKSYWIETTPTTKYPSLTKKISVDVAVIGAGISGLTTAFLLSKAGRSVAVLEGRRIVEGVTGHTTAKITSLHKLIYSELIDKFGREQAGFYGQSQESALELIASIVKEYKINCDFLRASCYTYTDEQSDISKVRKEVEAAKSLGLPATYEEKTDLPFPIKGAIRFANQAHFHPRKYLLKLAEIIEKQGGQIYENSRVVGVKEDEPCIISTENGEIQAKEVVVATHYPILDRGLFFARQVPVRHYALAAYLKGEVPKGMYINTGSNVFSLRPQPAGNRTLAIVTGVGHPAGQAKDALSYYEKLEEIARGKLAVESIPYFWSTQDNYTIDRVPYIGRYTPLSRHLYVATGFNGWGMSGGTVAGILLADLIIGRVNPWSSLYDPARIEQVKSMPELIKGNIETVKAVATSKLFKAKEDGANLKGGEGAVVTENGEKMAVYRDDNGKLHKVSPHCTHMGCVVNFNNAEKSWDCPCHGSRFDTDGNVLQSPAVRPLPQR